MPTLPRVYPTVGMHRDPTLTTYVMSMYIGMSEASDHTTFARLCWNLASVCVWPETFVLRMIPILEPLGGIDDDRFLSILLRRRHKRYFPPIIIT